MDQLDSNRSLCHRAVRLGSGGDSGSHEECWAQPFSPRPYQVGGDLRQKWVWRGDSLAKLRFDFRESFVEVGKQ